jgi:hypothetical protein
MGKNLDAVITPFDRPNVEAFKVLAERYCAFIETSESLGRGEFVWQLAEQLIALYAAGMKLPSATGDDDFDAPDAMATAESRELFQRLDRTLGDASDYSLMFDPYDFKTPPVTGSLADDASDVYRDLKRGLEVISAGGSLENAVWEWQFGFDYHWGAHAAHALKALHSLTHPGSVKWVARNE